MSRGSFGKVVSGAIMGAGGHAVAGMTVASGVVRFWGFGWEALFGVRWWSQNPGAWVRRVYFSRIWDGDGLGLRGDSWEEFALMRSWGWICCADTSEDYS